MLMLNERLSSDTPPHVVRFLAALHEAVPGRGWILFVLMLAGTLTEGVGILLLVPLLSLAGLDLGGGSLGRIAETISAAFRTVGADPTLPVILALFVCVVAGRALLQYVERITSTTLEQSFIRSLRERVYRAAVRSEWRLFARRRTADIAHALIQELNRVSAATTCFFLFIAQLLVGFVYFGFAVAISPLITAVAGLSGACLLVVLRRWNDRARSAGREVTAAGSALNSTLHEHLASIKLAKSYGAEEVNIAIFSELLGRVSSAYIRTGRNYSAFSVLYSVGSVLILSMVVYIAVDVLAVTAATLLLLLFLFARVVPRFGTMQQNYHYFLNILPAFSRVMDLIEDLEAEAEPRADRMNPLRLDRELRLSGVRFSYDGSHGSPTVHVLDFAVAARRTTAIVGPSGAGKSTIADLIMGLLLPADGQILIDDQPLGPDTLRAWRAQVGYVSQDPFLFHDTVRANLLWARAEATEPELWEALRMAAAADFVAGLPKGLDTVVGDRGILVSGGERQRLVLARALLREPALLVLDEATSSLDAHSERGVQEALSRLRGRITIVIISHRLASIREADNIYVVDGGEVVESGTWDALVERESGHFRELCRAQGLLEAPADSSPSAPESGLSRRALAKDTV